MKPLYPAKASIKSHHSRFARTRLKAHLSFWHDCSGVTALEYALLASFIAVPLAFATSTFNIRLQESFNSISEIFEQGAKSRIGGFDHNLQNYGLQSDCDTHQSPPKPHDPPRGI